jgi:hypothetical protein
MSVSYSLERNFAFTLNSLFIKPEYISGLTSKSETNTILQEVTIVFKKCD